MKLFYQKIGAILLILIESIFFALFPVLNKKFKSNQKLMGLANAFSGGIFIAAGILHVLPDANEAYSDAMTKKGKTDPDDYFPWPNFCCILSFSFVFLIDKVVFDPHQLLHAAHDHSANNHNHLHHKKDEGPILDENSSYDDTAMDSVKPRSISHTQMSDKLIEKHHHENELDLNHSYYPYILVLAMGIHASFSGLALGIFDEQSAFYGFFLAIILHKWAEALTIGISFSKSNISRKRAILMVLIFALATPLGTLIGVLIDSENKIVKGILLSISAGTFLYIAAAEIIAEEFGGPGRKTAKFILYLLGIGFMVFLWFLEGWTSPDDDNSKKIKSFM